MNVYLSKLAESKLIDILETIQIRWGNQAKVKFLKNFVTKKNQIAKQPLSCPQSTQFVGLLKCVVSKQTTFYYRINQQLNEIEIITVFDNRQNPESLKGEL
jgi:plasmid stabilization system protein ParE